MVKSITCYMLDEGGQLTLNKITEETEMGVWISNSQKSEKQCHAAIRE